MKAETQRSISVENKRAMDEIFCLSPERVEGVEGSELLL